MSSSNVAALLASIAAKTILTTNLAMHLDAGNSASYTGSGATFSDLVNSYHWTISGATFNGSAGGLSSSEYFLHNGNNQYFTLAAAHAGTILRALGRSGTPFSLEMWVYLAATTYQLWLGNAFGSGENGHYFNIGRAAANKICFDNIKNDPSGFAGATTPSTSAWHQIGWSGNFNGGAARIYLDGAVDANTTHTTTWTTGDSTRVPVIGARPSDLALDVPNGSRTAIVRIYSADIGAAGFLQNFNANKARFGL